MVRTDSVSRSVAVFVIVLMSQNDVPSHLMVCDGKIGEYGGTSCRKRRQKGEKAQAAEKSFPVHFQRWII